MRGTDFVVVTIFVNPLQFGAGEDLDRYPRDLAATSRQCERERVDGVFAPPAHEMYPTARRSRPCTSTASPTDLCGAARPTHFDGVTTVVTKLFAIIGPCAAYFGRKDAQQLAVITRMAADLNLPVEVVGCPLVREPDGLAMSSRNAYLTSEQRHAALVLSRALAARPPTRSSPASATAARVAAHRARHRRDRADASSSSTSRCATRDDSRRSTGSTATSCVALAARVGDDPSDRQRHALGARRRSNRRSRRPGCRSEANLMHRTMMKSKIHRATVTGAEPRLRRLDHARPRADGLADIREFEQVAVLDIDNGARFETYAMEGGPGDVILNGAAARLVQPGDRVIVITYASYDEAELAAYAPMIVHVDEANRPIAEDEAVQRAGSNLVWMRDHRVTHAT